MIVDFNVYLKDPQGNPIKGAIVLIHSHTTGERINPTTRNVDAGSCNFYHGPPIENQDYDVTAWAAGYAPRTTGDTPVTFGQQSVELTLTLQPSFEKPGAISRDAFRALNLRGNMGGMVLPGLGLSTTDALFDPMIPWYPESVQAAIFAEKKKRGINAIGLCSWADYHGSEFGMPVRYDWTIDPRQAAAYCAGLRQKGFIPLFWLLGDRVAGDSWDPSGGSCDNALNLIAKMLPAIKDLVGAASPGFELRGPGNACPYAARQYWRMLILMNQIAPSLYKFGHFVMENSAGCSHSPVEDADPWHGDEIGFWVNSAWPEGSTLLDGFFYQAPVEGKLFDGDAWEDRWIECRDRIGAGNRIWPPPCTNVDLIWGEAGWYDITRGARTEAQLNAVSARALQLGGKWSFSGGL